MSTLVQSSGDLTADRRYRWAQAALAESDFAAAEEILRQVLDLMPEWPAAWVALGQALVERGDTDAAAAAYAQAFALDPQDRLGASLHLANLGHPLKTMPPAFVRGLFDQYASRFDAHLVETLGYCGPEYWRAAIESACVRLQRPGFFPQALDLGCGTGLVGRSLAGLVGHLDGVDLSPNMIEAARRTGLYRMLAASDIGVFLHGRDEAVYDLVCAADVFIYVGDLAPVFQAVKRALVPRGLFAFTTQTQDATDFLLGSDMRFAHSELYLRQSAEKAGFELISFEPVTIRTDRGVPIAGHVTVLTSG